MKQPDYVYTVVQMYRKYTDIYLQKGKKGSVSQRRTKKSWKIVTAEEGVLVDGYYRKQNGKEMLSLKRPEKRRNRRRRKKMAGLHITGKN